MSIIIYVRTKQTNDKRKREKIMKNAVAIITFKNILVKDIEITNFDILTMLDAIKDDDSAYHMNDEIEFILDAECGHIVYENVNHRLVKIDKFVFEQ